MIPLTKSLKAGKTNLLCSGMYNYVVKYEKKSRKYYKDRDWGGGEVRAVFGKVQDLGTCDVLFLGLGGGFLYVHLAYNWSMPLYFM